MIKVNDVMSAILGFVTFVGLMVIGAPIAFAMLIAGLVAVWLKPGMPALVVMQNLFRRPGQLSAAGHPVLHPGGRPDVRAAALTDVLLKFASPPGGHAPRAAWATPTSSR